MNEKRKKTEQNIVRIKTTQMIEISKSLHIDDVIENGNMGNLIIFIKIIQAMGIFLKGMENEIYISKRTINEYSDELIDRSYIEYKTIENFKFKIDNFRLDNQVFCKRNIRKKFLCRMWKLTSMKILGLTQNIKLESEDLIICEKRVNVLMKVYGFLGYIMSVNKNKSELRSKFEKFKFINEGLELCTSIIKSIEINVKDKNIPPEYRPKSILFGEWAKRYKKYVFHSRKAA